MFDRNLQGAASAISVATYIGADPIQQQVLAPSIPAVYAWIFDFRLLLGRPEDDVDQALGRFMSLQGRIIAPSTDPFLRAQWRAARPALPLDRREVVVGHLAAATEFGQQLADMGNRLQRPSYCGISENLQRRLTEHLDQQSHLIDDLAPVRAIDCTVLWVPVDVSTVRKDDGGEDDFDEGRALRIFESFLIRTAAPLLNEVMDS